MGITVTLTPEPTHSVAIGLIWAQISWVEIVTVSTKLVLLIGKIATDMRVTASNQGLYLDQVNLTRLKRLEGNSQISNMSEVKTKNTTTESTVCA